MKKAIVIYGGGTFNHVFNHLSLSAPAFGNTARQLASLCRELIPEMETNLVLTKMADSNSKIITNEDLENDILETVQNLDTKVIFMTSAICDYQVNSASVEDLESNFYLKPLHNFSKNFRLKTKEHSKVNLQIKPSEKYIGKIRNGSTGRKDIFLVGFKTTCGLESKDQYLAGLELLKKNSCNLVFCNDTVTRVNMIICPEESVYHETTDRYSALRNLVEMVKLRSNLTFTKSTVVSGDPIPWESELIPSVLREIVDFCIEKGAYRKFLGVTAGHFAVKLSDTEFLTSRRKTDFNDMKKVGLVKVKTDGPDSVIAYGSKPSVGGQSQRIVFKEHEGTDCIVHFHCPIKKESQVPIVSQREYECGSHECGKNTSNNLKQFGNLKAVYLDNHGPNIVFNSSIDPKEVIQFIEDNFDLTKKTGGYQIS